MPAVREVDARRRGVFEFTRSQHCGKALGDAVSPSVVSHACRASHATPSAMERRVPASWPRQRAQPHAVSGRAGCGFRQGPCIAAAPPQSGSWRWLTRRPDGSATDCIGCRAAAAVGPVAAFRSGVWFRDNGAAADGALPAMGRDLRVSEGRLGLLVTAYALMVAVLAAPIGMATAALAHVHC
jgi:hypothetical protein